MDLRTQLTEAARGWIDEEAQGLASHPEAAAWERYAAGRLAPDEIEAMRDHLVACRACRGVVLAARTGAPTIVPEAGETADTEARRAFADLRRTLDEDAPPAGMPPILPRGGIARWVSPLVAALALGFAGWSWYQANQPRLGVVIAEAVPEGATRGVGAPERAEGAGRPLAVLVPVPGLTAGSRVRVEIVDGRGGSVWRGEGQATTDGELGLEIPARFRRIPGYRLRLWGEEGKVWKPLGTFVVAGERPAP